MLLLWVKSLFNELQMQRLDSQRYEANISMVKAAERVCAENAILKAATRSKILYHIIIANEFDELTIVSYRFLVSWYRREL